MNSSQIITIEHGKHLINPIMSMQIPKNFGFHSNASYLIHGENGTGKSSFVRNVLFKSIQDQCRGKIQYLYFDQEILSQYYYGKAYFAMNKKSFVTNIKDFIYSVVNLHLEERLYDDNRFVLLMDETDKYVDTESLIQLFCDRNITLINVSHSAVHKIQYDYNVHITMQDEFNSILSIQ